MEVPWQSLLSSVEMEDGEYFFSHLRDDSLDDNSLDDLREMLHQYTFSSEEDTVGFGLNNNVFNGNSSISHESIAWRHAKTATLSFEDSTVVVTAATVPNCGGSGGGSCNESTKRRGCNSGSTMDHIMAERRRRQELSQRFIALSAIIPGLYKIDKISILKEATTYVKQLQNRVKELEEQSAKMIIDQSSPSFINNNNYFYSDEGIVPYKKNSGDCHDELNNVALPKLEARVMEKEVLIRIHCEKNNDILLKALSHIKSLHFSVVSHGVLPFGKFSLAIAIVARMGDNCSITVKDLVKGLRQALFESPVRVPN